MQRYVSKPEDYNEPGKVDGLTGFVIEPKETEETEKSPKIDTLTGLPQAADAPQQSADQQVAHPPTPEGYDSLTGYSSDGTYI